MIPRPNLTMVRLNIDNVQIYMKSITENEGS